MIKQINITFTYDDTPKGFAPLATEIDDVDHRALAFCIAGILYKHDEMNPYFSSQVAEDIKVIKSIEEKK